MCVMEYGVEDGIVAGRVEDDGFGVRRLLARDGMYDGCVEL